MRTGGQRKPITDVHPHSKLHPLVSSTAEDRCHIPVGKNNRSKVEKGLFVAKLDM
jgi:hypothetical protein